MNPVRSSMRQLGVSLRALAVLTVLLGVVYPLAVAGIGQAALHGRANGSMVSSGGTDVGSALIGQSFTDADGAALPQWFQSRPSAAGDGYDGGASSGSNLGPLNEDLAAAVAERRAAVAELEAVAPADVPAEAVTASGSGLDPHISPEYARMQVDRVAAERGLDPARVQALVDDATQAPFAGILGLRTVNVLLLNISLAELDT
ncbi:potassium-transporting ATPase subunit KdpC [Arthrobacter sp. zg-Y411]|uniref:potassium-transporting ATPase subunit KdpC n=1 Tax=Arthrobacter TaxID=1663 RepID=UPI001D1522EE|nr:MULTISPECIES: potassium-transporting ATPase subunit KdpC [Arthrobacter]MCC3293530.1 potassium-transporting ATPase subunit KdpC [Arthrobacter zhangbolii]MDN3904688.1 potassium-transporting ATPase subunit KdpC [Arthrobacter sp. YD2]